MQKIKAFQQTVRMSASACAIESGILARTLLHREMQNINNNKMKKIMIPNKLCLDATAFESGLAWIKRFKVFNKLSLGATGNIGKDTLALSTSCCQFANTLFVITDI